MDCLLLKAEEPKKEIPENHKNFMIKEITKHEIPVESINTDTLKKYVDYKIKQNQEKEESFNKKKNGQVQIFTAI